MSGEDCEGSAGAEDCGGSWIGIPVRECRRGGIMDVDCVGGERMRRRRGLVICLDLELAGMESEAIVAVLRDFESREIRLVVVVFVCCVVWVRSWLREMWWDGGRKLKLIPRMEENVAEIA